MSKSDEAKAREHRLAVKLRENLKRRKQRATSDDGDSSPAPPVAGKRRAGKDDAG